MKKEKRKERKETEKEEIKRKIENQLKEPSRRFPKLIKTGWETFRKFPKPKLSIVGDGPAQIIAPLCVRSTF